MDTTQSSQPTWGGPSRAFLRIVPLNAEARFEFSNVVDWLHRQRRRDDGPHRSTSDNAARIHARRYMHIEPSPVKDSEVGNLIRQRDTGLLSASPPCSSLGDHPPNEPHVLPSPRQPSNKPTAVACIWTGFYFLGLDMPPRQPARGWSVGRLRSDHLHNDIILSIEPSPLVMARKHHAVLQLSNLGRITVRGAANADCHVNDTILSSEGGKASNSALHINDEAATLTLGKLKYQVVYEDFSGTKHYRDQAKIYLERYLKQQISPLWDRIVKTPRAGVNRVPSGASTKIRIGQWQLTRAGTVGSGRSGRVSIGVNDSGETAALKRFTVDGDRERINFRREKIERITQLAKKEDEQRVLRLREALQDDTAEGRNYAVDVWFVLQPVVSSTLKKACQQWSQKDHAGRLKATRHVLLEILGPLDFLHRNGWMHGDLKHINVGVLDEHAENFQIVLLDMDEAFPAPERGRLHNEGPGNTGGTIGWLSPEREMKGYNQSCDVWSLGVLVVWLVTGEHPWLLSENPWQPGRQYKELRHLFHAKYQCVTSMMREWNDAELAELTLKMLRHPYAQDRQQQRPRITVAEAIAVLKPDEGPEHAVAKDFGHRDSGMLRQVLQDCDLILDLLMACENPSDSGESNNHTLAGLRSDSIADIASTIGE
ncbi:Protein kinase-like domain protein [Cordyceps fumosorosea ARSEF 2679]|uniref:Protein kinase-like domain protein n=1 Tax=Cordyceps fumosorosea (strain ARSEF 2679) TaxID=1081104 RepID=A0A167LGT0_CORFA|nr:Protein kinase-like domain protein [Cordyceps fumosorosea ARSEF 2679]OAA53073.1 Protein kinase-like domain protein [Cordyceps fumosorosea ARSEF 2679]